MATREPKIEDYGAHFDLYDDLFKKEALAVGISWKIIKAICMNESSLGLNPRVSWGAMHPEDIENSKSFDGLSWGVMQLRPSTAKGYDPDATAIKLNDAAYSIHIGAMHLKCLIGQFGGEEEFAVKAYNLGAAGERREIAEPRTKADDIYWERYQAHKGLLG